MTITHRETEPAKYIIEQRDVEGAIIYTEEIPISSGQDAAEIRATELERLKPSLNTTWYLRGALTEARELPGIVTSKFVDTATLYDVQGVDAVRASVNGADLELRFFVQLATEPGQIVEFYDKDDRLVAEVVL